jgi:transposase
MHVLSFDVPIPLSTESENRNPDKQKLRKTILTLHAQGMSYRKIAREVGRHWTRVGQIVKEQR